MVEMCRVAGNRDRLIVLVLLLAENLLNIFLIHFQNRFAEENINRMFLF